MKSTAGMGSSNIVVINVLCSRQKKIDAAKCYIFVSFRLRVLNLYVLEHLFFASGYMNSILDSALKLQQHHGYMDENVDEI
jgi:hypothetical protein